MSEREEHREGLWCAELRCKRCYGADTWMQSEIPALRARVARLEGAVEDAEKRCRSVGQVRIAADLRAALAPDTARKEGV